MRYKSALVYGRNPLLARIDPGRDFILAPARRGADPFWRGKLALLDEPVNARTTESDARDDFGQS